MSTWEDHSKRTLLYRDMAEEKLHLHAIHLLSSHVGESADTVRRLYEIVLKRFKKEAKIGDFLSLLVSKRVKYLFLKRKGRKIPETSVQRRERA